MKRASLAALLFAICVGAARAQPAEPTPAAREQARQAFARAIALADEQRPKEALVELERAYALSPHFAVLYNLGKTYAALDMPVEAIGALEGYLSEGGERIEPARRAQVEALIAAERARVATLSLDVAPDGAEIAIDGHSIGTAPVTAGKPVVPGEHIVRIALAGHAPVEQRIALSAGQRTVLHVRLTPEAGSSAAERGLLALRCALPDVRVALGERELGTTPLPEVALPPGAHTLVLTREGYTPQQLAVDIRSGALTQAECALKPASPLPPNAASLAIAPSEADATIAIDGARAQSDALLPPGRHRLEITRPGFEPYRKDITLREREQRLVRPRLVPEPAYRRDYESRARAQRTWALSLGGAGLTLIAATASILIWNETRYADWRDEDRALADAFVSGEGDRDELQRRQELNNDAITDILRWQVVASATGAAGLLLGVAGALLFFSGDDPDRYEALDVKLGPGEVALQARGTL